MWRLQGLGVSVLGFRLGLKFFAGETVRGLGSAVCSLKGSGLSSSGLEL